MFPGGSGGRRGIVAVGAQGVRSSLRAWGAMGQPLIDQWGDWVQFFNFRTLHKEAVTKDCTSWDGWAGALGGGQPSAGTPTPTPRAQ